MPAVRTRLPWLVLAACLAACSSDELASDTRSIVLPTGFQVEIIGTGLANPTAMDLAPDGRIFVAEQTGRIRIVKNDALLATPFAQLSVDSANERGLVGLTLDPGFAQNGFVYVFYTTAQGGTHNRVSRFTAAGDVAVPGSERILVDFPALSEAANHNSGALDFGADGKLYVAHGDNADTAKAQDLNHPFGKILRFEPDGSIPTDNPFYATSTGLARAIWAYGVRNTFTFAFDQTSGVLYGNDVGGGDPEEINAIVRGANYGHGGGPNRVGPVHSYPRTEGRCAITGGTFYAPPASNFPALYAGRYFFADYCGGQIWSMNADGTGVTSFARESDGQLSNPVDLDVAADGSLYFLQRNNGAKIGRIFFGGGAECTSDGQCSDGNACNGAEACESGSCAAAAPLVCTDGNPCTTDSCSPAVGCVFPSNGTCAGDRLEAETATVTGATITNEVEASGGAYVDGGEGAVVRWSVSSTGGNATLGFAIRAPSGVRIMGVFVNGVRVGTVTTTTLRPEWAEPTVTAALVAGSNTVELRDSENSGEPDIDYLAVTGASAPACGDGTCGAGETCAGCPTDCGACDDEVPAPLRLTRSADGGGWSNVAGLTDGNLVDKVSTGSSPACLEYALDAPSTITSARLLEDNAGAWSVTSWSVEVDSGAGFAPLFTGAATPNGMPAWNEVDPADADGVTRVRICLAHAGVVEAAELEVWGVARPVVCGDRRCSSTETCGACPWDCGTCPGGAPGLDARPVNPGCVATDPHEAPPPLLGMSPCVVTVGNPPVFAEGVVPYALAEPFWSDGAVKARHLALPDGATLAVGADGDLTLPPGAVTIKSFQWQGQLIETRFFVRFSDGTYGAWTYAWNDAQTEAALVDPAVGAARSLPGGQLWRYPTRSQCFDCHAEAAGWSLGLEARQLDSDLRYPATGRTANQLRTLEAIGMLSGDTAPRPPLPAHDDERASLQLRAEAYLHVNCSNCHRPGGTGHGSADYRYDTPFAQKNVCNRRSILDAFPGLDLVEPGAHDQSVVWLRMSQRVASFMPPLGSTVADAPGASLLARWIDGLTGCPAD